MKADEKSRVLASSRRSVLTLACLSVPAFLLSLFPIEQRFLWDEATYLASAENLFAQAPYYSELRLDTPLLLALLNWGAHLISLDLFARLLTAAFFTAGVVFLYLLGTKLYGYLEGLSAAVLMLLSPFFVGWAHLVSPYIPAGALALGSVFFLFAHVEDQKPKSWSAFLSGMLLAAAVLMHWVSGFAAICAFYLVLTRRLQAASLLFYVMGCLAALAPYLAAVYVTGGELFGLLLPAAPDRSGPVISNFLANLNASYRFAGPMVLFGLILRLFLLGRERRSDLLYRDLPILLWFLLPFLLLSLVGQETQALLTAAPPLFVLAGRGFSFLRDNHRAVWIALAIPVAAAYTVTYLDDFRSREPWMDSMLEYSGQTRDASSYLRENSLQDSVLYSNHLWPVLAYHSKRKTTALWPRDERFYRFYPENMENDGYLVYYRGVEKKPDEEWLNGRPEFQKVAEFQNVVVYSYTYTGVEALGPELVKRLEEARNYFEQGSYDSVLEVLEPIQIPHVDVDGLRGWSYYRLGRIAEAAEAFERGLRSEPDNPRCMTGLGYSEMRMGQTETARQRFQKVLAKVPDKTNALVGLGLAELRLRNKAGAAQAFRQALELSPESEEIQKYLKQAEEP